jgi:hypothetical protein
MRFLVLIAASLLACSSDETPGATSEAYKCTSRGYVCWDNPPLRCVGPNYRDVSDPALKNVCGKSVGDGTTDVPCCEKIPDDPKDSGTPDTGMSDAAGDATDASDAVSDALDAAETVDAAEGG